MQGWRVTNFLWQTNLSGKLKVLHNSSKYEKPSLSLFIYLFIKEDFAFFILLEKYSQIQAPKYYCRLQVDR